MLDDNTKVEVESIGRGAVGYQPISNPSIKRIWHKPGVKKRISLEELREVVTAPGGYALFTKHLLIKDPEVCEELDLPFEDNLSLSETEIEELLKGNPAKLKSTMPNLHRETQERIAEKAAEMKIDNMSKLQIIKEHSGIDVYKTMQDKETNQSE